MIQIEQNVLFHVREKLTLRRAEITRKPEDITAAKHLDLFGDYIDATFESTNKHLSSLLGNKEITYDLLWALFKPNTEVYTTCPGTGASRCVLFNHCEERKDMSGKFMYLETRFLASNGNVLGEVTTGLRIPYFRGTNRIELLAAYPLQYHPEKDETRNELIRRGCKYVSLMGVHHKQYLGRAFDYDNEGEIVARHVEGRIIVDAVCFQESKPNYPCPRVQKVRPRYSILGRCDAIKLADLDPAKLEQNDHLICSPTVFGFSMESKAFRKFFPLSEFGILLTSCSRVRCCQHQ